MAKVFSARVIDRLEAVIGSRKLGQIFLELGYLTEEKLQDALDYQIQNGGRLGWILAALGYITRLELYEGLAKHLSIPFETDIENIRGKIDGKLALSLSNEEMQRCQVIPYYKKGNSLTVLTAEPGSQSNTNYLLERFNVRNIDEIVITDLDVMKLSAELHRDTVMETAVNGFLHRAPEESAYTVFTGSQAAFIAGFLCAFGVCLYINPQITLLSMLIAVQFFYIVPVLFKLALAIIGSIKRSSLPGSPARPFNEHGLPVYTILVPAYKEKAVIGNLIKCIKKLDYPEDKLDIILLLEDNDEETLQAAKAERPPASWRFLVCPGTIPYTKYRVLNYGLNFARGEFLAVYDAGDLPEPGQLKKAVAAFRAQPDDYICFQSAAAYFNRNENFLTKMSALENSGWHYNILPGLFKTGMPVPPGSSGAHYDIKKLKKLGAWDPYNVAADADLGARASAEGFKTGVIDSDTYEEATPLFTNWIRQRSRQVKGLLQTCLLYNRSPFKSLKALGLWRWLSFNLLTGGTPVVFILNPVMWLLLGLSILGDVSGRFYVPSALIYLMALNLIAANAITIFTAIMGAFPLKNRGLIFHALLYPVYWMLQSLAAYKGLWQLFTKPFYWEKTIHGITKSIPASQTLHIPDDASELVVVKNNKR